MVEARACESRLGRLRRWMEAEGLDAFLLRSTTDIWWLTAFLGVYDEEQAHAVLVTADSVLLHTDSRYFEAARRQAGAGPIQVDGAPVGHAAWCAQLLRQGQRLGFDDLLSLREYTELAKAIGDSASLVSTSDAVLGLRAVKDDVELAHLRAAQEITDAGFDYIIGQIRPGASERSIQLKLDAFMREQGADGLAFATIVATGENASNPHAQPGDAIVQAGDAVVMDFGARVAGYCADMTRTVFVGTPDGELARAYAALRRANEECERMLAPGITGASVHARSQEILAEEGFGGMMGHGLGHGVGLDIHELPVLSPRNREPLPDGCVVTVEPGIYRAGRFGMRLEDCGVVDADGFHPFGRSTHEMVIV